MKKKKKKKKTTTTTKVTAKTRQKEVRGLGTVAMAEPEKRTGLHGAPCPRLLSPPPAALRGGEKRTREREMADSLQEAPTVSPNSPRPSMRDRQKRKTILERIEGWWDLGLLERRPTLPKGGNRSQQ
ncbi:hypothetical protein XA68_11816 [Ophiocordyceps unilateralis]|uniref:Uncharacterized protein n=1 Tax=Ophiocordyceps unilateralis TaxID=268505 RepID=A0A2A9PNK4_OPHUN|nr:hypothetical protein XA68_11816 [Ophiocordyceps unilateralis]